MRKALVRVGGQESISEVLRRIGPVELDTYLEDGPGFRVRFVGQEVQQAQKAETLRRYLFEGTGLAAHVAIEYNTELSVAVQRVTLTNTGYEPTPPIQDVNALYLPLKLDVGDQPYAFSYGGGLTDGFYPPRAYRKVRFQNGERERT